MVPRCPRDPSGIGNPGGSRLPRAFGALGPVFKGACGASIPGRGTRCQLCRHPGGPPAGPRGHGERVVASFRLAGHSGRSRHARRRACPFIAVDPGLAVDRWRPSTTRQPRSPDPPHKMVRTLRERPKAPGWRPQPAHAASRSWRPGQGTQPDKRGPRRTQPSRSRTGHPAPPGSRRSGAIPVIIPTSTSVTRSARQPARELRIRGPTAPPPGAAGVDEAVFEVGPGRHQFTGPRPASA
jgi:hypothetical protein